METEKRKDLEQYSQLTGLWYEAYGSSKVRTSRMALECTQALLICGLSDELLELGGLLLHMFPGVGTGINSAAFLDWAVFHRGVRYGGYMLSRDGSEWFVEKIS